MSRGQTWSFEEVQALIDIWSEDYMSQLLVATHKNYEVFKLFSERMAARGFNRSAVQCRIKVKKLRQQYVKVRDSLRRSGSSGEEKEKFIWYDDLDSILGTRPTSSPKVVIESFKEEVPWTSTAEEPADVFKCSVSLESDKSGDPSYGEVHPEEDESTASSGSPRPQQENTSLRWATPGAQGRKRKSWTERLDSFLESYMQHKRKMDKADQKRHDEERAAFENFNRLQQEAEERRFKAIQEQQQANNQLLLHMMGTFARALLPQSHTPPAQWMPTTSTVSPHARVPHNPPAAMAKPRNAPSPLETSEHPVAPMAKYLSETMAPCSSSSVLHDVCLDSVPCVMPVVKSSLSKEQQKKLLSLLGHVRLHLLYKASVHGFTAAVFHSHCDNQGPTVIVAYNAAGFVFGAYTSKDYSQSGEAVTDEEAFLYSISAGGNKPLRVAGISGQSSFTDGSTGPDFGALVFLNEDKPEVQSKPGTSFHFQAAAMHGDDLNLTEFEVYRVEGLGELLDKPWRNIKWTAEKKQQLMTTIQSYQPEIKTVHQARVLLVGPVGSGKSSFFNSINSVFRGNMTSQAIAGTAGKSVTTQFRTYTVKAGKGGGALPLILCDTMGLEENADAGLDIEDLVNIYKGHVKDRYQFSPSNPLQADAPSYKKQTTVNDMIHCVIYMVDTCKVSLLTQKMLDKFATIRKKTNQLGIPQILLMTKVDEACLLVAEDLKNVYRSVYIQRKARELSESLGIPLSCVLPVKNYSEELELDQDTDILLLTAMEHMLNYADSFFENQLIEDQDGSDQQELYRSSDLNRPGFSERPRPEVV
ncbi:interferon-induced protein 44-like isoform X2 [Epinephelus moara]|uniref:interferon-induced protein 44-like isoform X2 n=1 Tax=Epinephelus moara TaxID=300413 RepID=UPI00214F4604|nr:interferon-induced protein 44-like isoform X2 [Epinephelus moara]